ncbi:sulfite reductase subunit beta [Gloeomargarita lithophora Alchichica-D10]|uniref:assimilatory sulfite reductase (ferredoxin) n=1 Tax=Gloeomargarita lithophora Alchichica-D10 TaxID=1188229 RepID=A0A1J0AAG5_9CYAN|nr:NADPH-dependent assimilatory sulfite reductase hemoprotein subunit [Gloeomargarita lithophora]APB32897.1 sulfite reductase subunit beta [Gloeomargarita lithophora Alchichica-D10]
MTGDTITGDTSTAVPPTDPAGRLPRGEAVKLASNYLQEPLATEARQPTRQFSEPAVQILKFHGSYQQDDRDKRRELRQQGLERDFSLMLRTRQPGGHVPAPLYATLSALADQYGNGTLRVTTRQTFQMHGVLKGNLQTVIEAIVRNMGSTLATCGDINRNVMAPPAPFRHRPSYRHAQEYARKLSDLLLPRTRSYYDLWIDDEQVEIPVLPQLEHLPKIHLDNPTEPLYGNQYLPRKFKCAITVPDDNSVDIYSQDIGLIVVTDTKGALRGFNILVGGGMGRTHNKEETFPLLGQPLGFAPVAEIETVMQAILAVQRDHGNRQDRKQARMKYLVHTWGIRKFRQKVQEYVGQKLKPWQKIPPFPPGLNYLGWQTQGDGKLFLGLSIPNGRIADTAEMQLKTALRLINEQFALPLQLSPTQDVILMDIDPHWRGKISEILRSHRVPLADDLSPFTRLAMACPALPTCGLAITESERVLPNLVQEVETLWGELGLGDTPLIIRMTGCPNGCARPYLAELGLVGTLPGHYQVWVGASANGDRLAQVLWEKMPLDGMTQVLKPIFTFYKQERYMGERFGDFCQRVGLTQLQQRAAES